MKALRERGLAIPRDAAVVGFDDTPITRFVDPPLTTIQQPYRELGRTAMRVLIGRIDGEKPVRRAIVLPAPLVVRGVHLPVRRRHAVRLRAGTVNSDEKQMKSRGINGTDWICIDRADRDAASMRTTTAFGWTLKKRQRYASLR